jgi:hypothetical protein
MARRPSGISIDPEAQKRLGIELFNLTWTLLEDEDRSARDNERMIDAAHASRGFWELAGGPTEHARAEWLIARVYATLGRAEPALHHAHRCLTVGEARGLGEFDLACAHEALARAFAAGGDRDAAAWHLAHGRELAGRVADAEERELVLGDLATVLVAGA